MMIRKQRDERERAPTMKQGRRSKHRRLKMASLDALRTAGSDLIHHFNNITKDPPRWAITTTLSIIHRHCSPSLSLSPLSLPFSLHKISIPLWESKQIFQYFHPRIWWIIAFLKLMIIAPFSANLTRRQH